METVFYKRNRRKKGWFRKYIAYLIAVISSEERVEYIKSVKNYFTNLPFRFYVGVVVSIGFIIGVLYIMFFSGYFLITEIEVESRLDYIGRDVKPYFEKTKNDKVFGFLPRTTIISAFGNVEKKVLKENPVVKGLDISFSLPGTMKIVVEERTHHGIWCSASEIDFCFFYADDGVIFTDAPTSTRGFLLRYIRDERLSDAVLGDTVLSEQDMYEVDLLYKALSLISEQPEYVTIRDVQEIRAGFNGGWEAYFSRKYPYVRQVENIKIVLEKNIGSRRGELEYIDARFGDKLFFRYETTPLPTEPVLQVGPIKKEEEEGEEGEVVEETTEEAVEGEEGVE